MSRSPDATDRPPAGATSRLHAFVVVVGFLGVTAMVVIVAVLTTQ